MMNTINSANITNSNLSNSINDPQGISVCAPSTGGSNHNSRNNSIIGSSLTIQIKIILVGDIAVGKTCLFTRFTNNTLPEKYVCTLTIESKIKQIIIDQSTCAQMEIWDTCGEERFRALTSNYFRKADGIIVLFDLTQKTSFNNLGSWLNEIKANANSDIQIIIAGNKRDKIKERVIKREEAERFCLENNITYLEVSAKNGTNVDLLFEKLAYSVVKKKRNKLENEDNNHSHENFIRKIAEKKINKAHQRDVGCC